MTRGEVKMRWYLQDLFDVMQGEASPMFILGRQRAS